MVVKFFANKKGGSTKAIDYLLNERTRDGTAKILQGDEKLTRKIISSLNFKHKVTVGCLSFEEQDIKNKTEIIESFEKALLCDMKDRVNILWVEHTDKNRLELNFVIPKVDLESKKSFNPYYHQQDLPRIEAWQDLTNLENNFSNPKDPLKQKSIKTFKFETDEIKDYEKLETIMKEMVVKKIVKNRDELIAKCQSYDIEITRKSENYISLKLPEAKKAKRFKGGIYSDDERFYSDGHTTQYDERNREETENSRRDNREFDEPNQSNINTNINRYKFPNSNDIPKLRAKLEREIERKNRYIKQKYSNGSRKLDGANAERNNKENLQNTHNIFNGSVSRDIDYGSNMGHNIDNNKVNNEKDTEDEFKRKVASFLRKRDSEYANSKQIRDRKTDERSKRRDSILTESKQRRDNILTKYNKQSKQTNTDLSNTNIFIKERDRKTGNPSFYIEKFRSFIRENGYYAERIQEFFRKCTDLSIKFAARKPFIEKRKQNFTDFLQPTCQKFKTIQKFSTDNNELGSINRELAKLNRRIGTIVNLYRQEPSRLQGYITRGISQYNSTNSKQYEVFSRRNENYIRPNIKQQKTKKRGIER